jgi:phosphoadenosine phosphosulfate reductase
MSAAFHLPSPEAVRELNAAFENAPLEELLAWAWNEYGTAAAIGTSFQGAGLVTIHHAVTAGIPLPVFTIDTGFLFPETLALKAQLESFFGIPIESIHPDQSPEQQAAELGNELWLKKPDLCCTLRKVVPLQSKLANLAVWITGVRRQQSDTRSSVQLLELYHFDVLRDRYILKLNPMAAWSKEQVQAYLQTHNIPTNTLSSKGYRSIGCTHCTRPTAAGEHERAGRWTGFDKAECGIHTFLGASI